MREDDEIAQAEQRNEQYVAHRLQQSRQWVMRGGRWLRIAVSIGGLLLIAAGLAMLVLPGPGLLAIGAGLAALAVSFTRLEPSVLATARWTGRVDARVRQRIRRIPKPALLGLSAILAGGVAGTGWWLLR